MIEEPNAEINNYSIVCTAFMTRKSDLNIEQRVK